MGMSMRRAAVVQLGSKYASIAAQLLITAVLARLVTPEQFGILAIVTVFTSFFTLFSDMGIGVAIVQFQDLTEHDFGRLFGFSVVLATALALAFCAAGAPIAAIYGEAELVPLCCASSATLLLATLNMVPNGIMLRERKFAQIGLRLVVATVVSGACGIAGAVAGWGAYALVAQNVMQYAVVLVWNLLSRPILHVSLHFRETLRHVFAYSAFQFGSSLINYFNRNLDNLLVGRVAGPAALGYYDKAYKLTTYPMTSFSSVIASVVQPYMASHQDEPDVIFDCWRRMCKLCSLVGAAIAVCMFCCSEEIVTIMYGDNWATSVPILHALAAGVYAQMVGNPTGAFFQSLGRTDLMFRCSVANTLIMVAAISSGSLLGDIVWLSWLVSAAFFCQLVSIAHYLVRRGFHKSVTCMAYFVPETVCAVVAVAITNVVAPFVPDSTLFALAAKLAVSGLSLLALFAVCGQLEPLRALFRRA